MKALLFPSVLSELEEIMFSSELAPHFGASKRPPASKFVKLAPQSGYRLKPLIKS